VADELDNFIAALTTNLAAMTGIKVAPEHPPEALNEFPFAVSYFTRGEFDYSQSGPSIGLHTVHVDIHLGRSVLHHDEKHARPFILRGLTMIAGNLKMNNTCDHCILKSYEYGGLGYGETLKTFGVRYILEVKIKHTGITVAA
jgi:hypothetical protein